VLWRSHISFDLNTGELNTFAYPGERISGIEENMLLAGLCDLIERIWSHGLHSNSSRAVRINQSNQSNQSHLNITLFSFSY
jgi:hypothetical protein